MKKVRYLKIEFDNEIKPYEIPAFRGAVIKKVGQDNILFHHHINNEELIFRYPLIQYKEIYNRPTLFCMEEGVDEIHKFFEKKNWDIELSGRTLQLKVFKIDLNQLVFQVWDKLFDYEIRNWIALNKENYAKFKAIENEIEKKEFLKKILIGNIISMAKSIEWTIDKQIELEITKIKKIGFVTLKETKVLGITAEFKTNVYLPPYIGLGKSVSIGFGTVKKLKSKEKENYE